MRQLVYQANSNTGIIKLADNQKKVNLFELESNAVNLVFNFDKNIKNDEILTILFVNSEGSKPYTLKRVSDTQYSIEIPRSVLIKGLLGFTIQEYTKGCQNDLKYVLDEYLIVNGSGDVTVSIVDSHPDLIAELFFRIYELEKKVK